MDKRGTDKLVHDPIPFTVVIFICCQTKIPSRKSICAKKFIELSHETTYLADNTPPPRFIGTQWVRSHCHSIVWWLFRANKAIIMDILQLHTRPSIFTVNLLISECTNVLWHFLTISDLLWFFSTFSSVSSIFEVYLYFIENCHMTVRMSKQTNCVRQGSLDSSN